MQQLPVLLEGSFLAQRENVLAFGNPGSGKTHLLGRILTQSQQARFPFAFAYIQPLEDPEQTYRYLLREVMVNLFHPMAASPQATQFRRLVTRIFQEGLRPKSGHTDYPISTPTQSRQGPLARPSADAVAEGAYCHVHRGHYT